MDDERLKDCNFDDDEFRALADLGLQLNYEILKELYVDEPKGHNDSE